MIAPSRTERNIRAPSSCTPTTGSKPPPPPRADSTTFAVRGQQADACPPSKPPFNPAIHPSPSQTSPQPPSPCTTDSTVDRHALTSPATAALTDAVRRCAANTTPEHPRPTATPTTFLTRQAQSPIRLSPPTNNIHAPRAGQPPRNASTFVALSPLTILCSIRSPSNTHITRDAVQPPIKPPPGASLTPRVATPPKLTRHSPAIPAFRGRLSLPNKPAKASSVMLNAPCPQVTRPIAA